MRSTFKLLFYINRQKIKKNGKCPVMGRITLDGKVSQYSTGEDVQPKFWDANKGRAVIHGQNPETSIELRELNRKLEELEEKLEPADPLNFPGYPAKLAVREEETGLRDAAVAAVGKIMGRKAVCVVLDSRFFMGSMSAAVGEKLTLAIEYAGKNKLPLILFAASGGARMQEGILSLMQMAKTSAALARFAEKGLLYISVLTDPTTGGVTASFASLGDIILAEPGALIGFAGPRVIQQTIGETLPEGFQRAEFQMEHGFVDAVVPRSELRSTLAQLLKLHGKGDRHG